MALNLNARAHAGRPGPHARSQTHAKTSCPVFDEQPTLGQPKNSQGRPESDRLLADTDEHGGDLVGERYFATPQRPGHEVSKSASYISRKRLFKMPVPHAPRSGMDYGLVRRVVGKYYVPGAPCTAFIHLL